MSGHVRGLIEEVLTGRVLSVDADATFRAHLRACPECRAYFDETLGVLRVARGGREAVAPGEVERALARAVRLVRPVEPTPSPWPWRTLFAGAVAVAAVVALVLAPREEVGVVLSAGKGLTVDGVAAAKDTVLLERAVLATDKEDSAVLLRVEGQKRGLLLRGGTTVKVLSVDEVELQAGRLRVQVKDSQRPLVVRTEVLRVVQDTAGVFIVERRPTGTLIAVHQGAVVVRAKGDTVELKEGQETELTPSGLSKPKPVAASSLIEDRGDGTVWGAILRFLRQLLDVISKALSGD